MNDWQIQEIHTAIQEANAGDFASDAEVKAVMDKWNARTTRGSEPSRSSLLK